MITGIVALMGQGKNTHRNRWMSRFSQRKNRPALLQSGVETTLVEPGQHTHISGRLRAEVHIITQADVGEHDFDENHG
jgi:hypothetical protein